MYKPTGQPGGYGGEYRLIMRFARQAADQALRPMLRIVESFGSAHPHCHTSRRPLPLLLCYTSLLLSWPRPAPSAFATATLVVAHPSLPSPSAGSCLWRDVHSDVDDIAQLLLRHRANAVSRGQAEEDVVTKIM